MHKYNPTHYTALHCTLSITPSVLVHSTCAVATQEKRCWWVPSVFSECGCYSFRRTWLGYCCFTKPMSRRLRLRLRYPSTRTILFYCCHIHVTITFTISFVGCLVACRVAVNENNQTEAYLRTDILQTYRYMLLLLLQFIYCVASTFHYLS